MSGIKFKHPSAVLSTQSIHVRIKLRNEGIRFGVLHVFRIRFKRTFQLELHLSVRGSGEAQCGFVIRNFPGKIIQPLSDRPETRIVERGQAMFDDELLNSGIDVPQGSLGIRPPSGEDPHVFGDRFIVQ